IHNEHIDGQEETTGQVRVQAWTLAKNGTREKRWNLYSVGNDGESLYEGRFVRVRQWGCCDWPQVARELLRQCVVGKSAQDLVVAARQLEAARAREQAQRTAQAELPADAPPVVTHPVN